MVIRSGFILNVIVKEIIFTMLYYILNLYLSNLLICFLFEGNYILSYLATRGPKLENFVVGALIRVLCRITKFGWLEDDSFREVVKESMNFLSQVKHNYSKNIVHLNS